jgi:hypothetical protein
MGKKKIARPTVSDHNLLTGDIIEREMNDAEYALYLSDIENDAQKAQQEQDAIARRELVVAKLATLNITEEDLRVMGL